jgi:hypothetical protein
MFYWVVGMKWWCFCDRHPCLKLVLVVGGLYLNLDYNTSAFSLPFIKQRFSSSLHHSVHSHISLLSPNQLTIPHLTILEFI